MYITQFLFIFTLFKSKIFAKINSQTAFLRFNKIATYKFK